MPNTIKSMVGDIIREINGNIFIGDTINQKFETIISTTNTGHVEGSNNVFIQGINDSNIEVKIEIPVELLSKYYFLIQPLIKNTEVIAKLQDIHNEYLKRIEIKLEDANDAKRANFYDGTHHHYYGKDNDDYERIREKISNNRGVGTSEILQNKSINDLDNKTLEIFFSKENIKKEIAKQDQNIEHLTVKEILYFLSLVENGHIFKGTFLCLAKFNQIHSVCYTAVETKFNLFKGTERNAILINDTIKGNILKQYEDTIIILQKHIPLIRNVYTSSDSYEIPFIAFKEIVANAFAHRSYDPYIQSFIQIELFDDRLEIKSPGLFPDNLDPENIEMSRIINPTIAAIFHLSGIIEKSGTGINRAQKEMADNGLKKIVFKQDLKQKFVKAIIYRPNYHNLTIPIPHQLTEPPFMPEVFLGRESDLKIIKDKLFSSDNLLLLVNGNGGVGKTSLVAKYYDLYKNEYTHVAWVRSQKSICNALLTLSGPLQVTFEASLSTAERLKQLLTTMAALPKPCLLVIDNANEIDDLKQNYQALRRCTNFHLLITSRVNHFEQAEYYHIDGLPYDMALELFKKYYPKHTESENLLFEQIHTAIGGNTLVVELLAKYLKIVNTYKTNYTLSGLLADLRTKGLLGLPTTKKVATDYQANHNAMREERPEAIVAAMYDLSELNNPEKDLLFVFAFLPAEPINYEMIKLLTGNYPDLEYNLDNLVQKGWIERNTITKEFKCNPLIQEIARKKNPKNPNDCEIIIHVLNENLDYVDVLKNLNYQKAAIFARYAEALVKSFDAANYNLSVLTERLGNYYLDTGDLDKALQYFNLRLQLSNELYEANPQ
ncbi:MAG: ATP-binding protein, partial [Mariniphaga sp.]